MPSPMKPSRLALIGIAVVIAVVSAGCQKYTGVKPQSSFGEKFGVELWSLNGRAPEKDAKEINRLSVVVTPGTTLTLDLAGSKLRGKVHHVSPPSGISASKVEARYRCINVVSWRMFRPGIGYGAFEEKVWDTPTSDNGDQCADGAVNRVVQIPIPSELPAGSTISMTIISDRCMYKGCAPRGNYTRFSKIMYTSWISSVVQLDLKRDAGGPPVVQLLQRVSPSWVDSSAPWWHRVVDARTSSDPSGGTLSYAWDLDNDGAYDDTSEAPPPGHSLAAGEAIVPASAFTVGGAVVRPTVGVRVTSSNGLSATGTITLVTDGTPIFGRENNYVSLSTETPVAGQNVDMRVGVVGGFAQTLVCIDRDEDNLFESEYVAGYGERTLDLTAREAGGHVVTVMFADPYASASDTCATRASDEDTLIFKAVYVSSAAGKSGQARQGGKEYGGTARITMSKAVVLKVPTIDGAFARGEILAGKYRLATPAKAGGVKRPTGLASFTRGDYAQKTDEVTFVPVSATRTVVIGSGTILLRGAKGALLCASVDSSGDATRYTFLGGKGAGATVRGTMTAPGLDFKGDWVTTSGLKLQKGKFVQTRKLSESATMATTTGKAAKLPAACKALVRHLPKAK